MATFRRIFVCGLSTGGKKTFLNNSYIPLIALWTSTWLQGS